MTKSGLAIDISAARTGSRFSGRIQKAVADHAQTVHDERDRKAYGSGARGSKQVSMVILRGTR